MKLSLVVADGVHQGKVIPITVPEFLIGRDPECQLRPASPQMSKKHCAVLVRKGKVFVRDFGSTNGTFINDEQVAGEIEVKNGDLFKAGPLVFHVKIELSAAKLATPAKPAATSAKTAVSAGVVAGSKSSPVLEIPEELEVGSEESDSERLAAILLGSDDEVTAADGTTEQVVPDGTTAMELPSIGGEPGKKEEKKPNANTGNTSGAAAAILQKYMRRPRT